MFVNKLKDFVCPKKHYPEDYPKEADVAIKTITISKYPIELFGSAVFKNLIYAGDIDIKQPMPITDIKSSMQKVIKQIHKKDYIIGDIKSGIKRKYSILLEALGNLHNGVIYNYKPDIIKKIANYHNLSISVIPPLNGIGVFDWVKLFDEIHQIITIRWTPDEILKGYKVDGNDKYILDECIKYCYNHALNKIDMYFILNDRIIEITNVFEPMHEDVNIEDIIYGIKINMLHNLLPDNLNYAKALKRAYTIARLEDDASMLNKISPFLVGNINLIASVYTDFNVISDILGADNQLRNIKDIILNHLYVTKEKSKKLNDLSIVKVINDLIKNINNEESFIDMLGELKKYLKGIINSLTKTYIKEYSINLKSYVP